MDQTLRLWGKINFSFIDGIKYFFFSDNEIDKHRNYTAEAESLQ